MSDYLNTALTQALGCRYPIVQTAMGWVADAHLVIASTQAGAFGFWPGRRSLPINWRAKFNG